MRRQTDISTPKQDRTPLNINFALFTLPLRSLSRTHASKRGLEIGIDRWGQRGTGRQRQRDRERERERERGRKSKREREGKKEKRDKGRKKKKRQIERERDRVSLPLCPAFQNKTHINCVIRPPSVFSIPLHPTIFSRLLQLKNEQSYRHSLREGTV